MPYGDYMPEGSTTPPELLRLWIMHGEMIICGTNVWFADEAHSPIIGNNVRLTATVKTGKEATSIFETLSADGDITLPPTDVFVNIKV